MQFDENIIPAKVKSVFETVGRLIKTLIEKIKSFFSKTNISNAI